jgi:hypothetical protein
LREERFFAPPELVAGAAAGAENLDRDDPYHARCMVMMSEGVENDVDSRRLRTGG